MTVSYTHLGSKVDRIFDVGVAGIHRLLSRTEEIREANCVIAVAGMEGALEMCIRDRFQGALKKRTCEYIPER